MAFFSTQKTNELIKNRPEGTTPEQVLKMLERKGHQVEGLNGVQAPEENLEQRLANVGTESATNISQAITGQGQFKGQSPIRRGVSATAEAFSTPLRGAFEMLPQGARNVLSSAGEKITEGFGKLTGKIAETPLFKEIGQLEAQGFINPQDNPEFYALKDTLGVSGSGGQIAGEILGAQGTVSTLSKGTNLISQGFNQIKNLPKPKLPSLGGEKNITNLSSKVADDIYSTVIEENPTLLSKIDDIEISTGQKSSELLKELVEEGGVPEVVNGRASYKDFRVGLDNKIKAFNSVVKKRSGQIDANIGIDEFKNSVISRLENAGAVAGDYTRILKQIENRFNSYKAKYGDTLTQEMINEIRVEANKFFKNTRSYEDSAWKFIGDTARARTQKVAPEITNMLDEITRLHKVDNLANTLDGKAIKVNPELESLGGFTGTVLLGATGIGALAGGPGSLLIAGLAAKFGAKKIADLIRKKKFNTTQINSLKGALNEYPDVYKQLLKEADEADRAILESL